MDDWQQWLVSFDTDRIKQYLFATNRLKEIRGGSALLCELDKERAEWVRELAPTAGEPVYSAGGGAVLLVPDADQATRLLSEVAGRFLRATRTATITGVLLPPGPANGRTFGERMRRAGERLRQAKAAKAELTALPVEPYLELCHSCGCYPAAEQATDGSGDRLCGSCAKKREKSVRSILYDDFCRYVRENQGEVWPDGGLPRDLDDVGRVSSPPNYVGFIALDGNGVGGLQSQLETVEQYRESSHVIGELVRERTFAALREHGRPREGVAPFEIVLIGGDDIFLITAADIAIEVALSIAEGFEHASRSELPRGLGLAGENAPLTMAGGVVLAHADFPIPAMRKLAEDLQKMAKKLCAKEKYRTGAIDFVVVSSSDASLEEIRKVIPHCRPYSLDKLRQLVDWIHQFKKADFPLTQLQSMYQALFSTRVNAQAVSIAALSRLMRKEDRSLYGLLRGFYKEFGVPLDGGFPPWVECEDREVSPLADLVELYPFIQRREGAHASHPRGG